MQQRLQRALKALLLISLGLFLYSRFANGTLSYYINQRFVVYTLIAVFGLLLVGVSYRWTGQEADGETEPDQAHEYEHTDGPLPNHARHSPSHAISWGGAVLVLLPVLLGLLAPPQPLGVAALENRAINLRTSEVGPTTGGQRSEKSSTDKHLLDWWREFQRQPNDDATFIGQSVKVVGFVYHDEKYGAERFLATRFVVSCCVADANVVAMLVEWPQAATLAEDSWVEVTGVLQASGSDQWQMPVIAASQVAVVDAPNQPYLYP
jgi:putative membrane protein